MADPHARNRTAPVLTERQKEIKKLRKVPRGERSQEHAAKLDKLLWEEGRERFIRLAPVRHAKVIAALASLCQCGNPVNYSFSQDEAAALLAKIDSAVEELKTAFAPREREAAPTSFIDPTWRR